MDNNLVEAIKTKLSVEEVIGDYLELKKTGESYKALSPFKAEKTPSLIVTPSKNMWKDFSSGRGGDIFKFVMEHEGVDFKEALRILAQKAGLNPQDYGPRSSTQTRQYLDLRKKLLKVLEEATSFYEEAYLKSAQAKNYLKKREFSSQTAKAFRIGYSPKTWQALTEHFKRLEIPAADLEAAGLIKKREIPAWLREKNKLKARYRWGDFFGDRLMIPLSNPQGEIIGFTGRLLNDREDVAKYVNTKQTLLYNKSKHVFGYFQAKEAIRSAGFVLVVEGNLDVIACHQAGYKQTVAAAGTALTLDHLKIIARLTKDVRLAFDGDTAGTAAMERSLAAASEAKVNLSIISLPTNLDPDELIKKDLKHWQQIVKARQPAPQWLYEKHKSNLDLQTATGKKELTDIMLPVINSLPDEVEKDHYLRQLEKDGISRSSLDKKIKSLFVSEPTPPPAKTHSDKPDFLPSVSPQQKIHLLLGLLLIEPQLRQINKMMSEKLEEILADYDQGLKLYVFLQQTNEFIDDVKEIKKSYLQTFSECVKIAFQTVHAAEKGRYMASGLDLRQRAFNDLFQELNIQQAKKGASRFR